MELLRQSAQNRIIVLLIAAAVDLLIGDPHWLCQKAQIVREVRKNRKVREVREVRKTRKIREEHVIQEVQKAFASASASQEP